MGEHDIFIKHAIEIALDGLKRNGGPFGCVIVKDGKIVGQGHNMVTSTNDPTAHAEVQCIRDACKNLGRRTSFFTLSIAKKYELGNLHAVRDKNDTRG